MFTPTNALYVHEIHLSLVYNILLHFKRKHILTINIACQTKKSCLTKRLESHNIEYIPYESNLAGQK